jgi:hypothetical protein
MTISQRLARLASATLVVPCLCAVLLGFGLRASTPTHTALSAATHSIASSIRRNPPCDAAPPCD